MSTSSRTELETPPKGKSTQSARRSESRTGWLFAAPALLLVAVFLLYPFFSAFYISTTNQRLISGNETEFVGLENYRNLLSVAWLRLEPLEENGVPLLDEESNPTYERVRSYTRDNPEHPELDGLGEWFSHTSGDGTKLVVLAANPTFMRAIINTVIFAIVIAPVQGGLGLILALLVNVRMRGTNLFRTVYFMPVVTSMVVIAILWGIILSPDDSGLMNRILSGMTGRDVQLGYLGDSRLALPSIIVMSIWQAVGFHMIIWLAGLQTIAGQLYEAAAIDGANAWQQFKHVTWPGLRSTAVFVLITITIAAFGLFIQIDVLTRGGPLDSTQTMIFQAVEQGFRRGDMGQGNAITVFFFFFVLAIALIQRYLTREKT